MNKGRRFVILSFKASCTDRCKTTKPCTGRFYWKSPRFTDLFTPGWKQFLEINYGAFNYVVRACFDGLFTRQTAPDKTVSQPNRYVRQTELED